jgi:hypothetical protein
MKMSHAYKLRNQGPLLELEIEWRSNKTGIQKELERMDAK